MQQYNHATYRLVLLVYSDNLKCTLTRILFISVRYKAGRSKHAHKIVSTNIHTIVPVSFHTTCNTVRLVFTQHASPNSCRSKYIEYHLAYCPSLVIYHYIVLYHARFLYPVAQFTFGQVCLQHNDFQLTCTRIRYIQKQLPIQLYARYVFPQNLSTQNFQFRYSQIVAIMHPNKYLRIISITNAINDTLQVCARNCLHCWISKFLQACNI